MILPLHITSNSRVGSLASRGDIGASAGGGVDGSSAGENSSGMPSGNEKSNSTGVVTLCCTILLISFGRNVSGAILLFFAVILAITVSSGSPPGIPGYGDS